MQPEIGGGSPLARRHNEEEINDNTNTGHCGCCGMLFRRTSASASNLKPFDPVAFHHTVEATAKELMLPGAMVLLHTPQGNFAFGYGTTELGVTTPPRADTYFRITSNTKTMTAP
jgi:CubicO group peptidase (beta-lactamase class C family)